MMKNELNVLQWNMNNYRHGLYILGNLVPVIGNQSEEQFEEDFTTLVELCGELTTMQSKCLVDSINSGNRYRIVYHALMIAIKDLQVGQQFEYVAPNGVITDVEDLQGLITQLSNDHDNDGNYISGVLSGTSLCPILEEMDSQDKEHTYGVKKSRRKAQVSSLHFH